MFYDVYFYHFGEEDKAISFMYSADDSVIEGHVKAVQEFLNHCEKADYKAGKKKLGDCKPWHFWIDGRYDISFDSIRQDAPETNKIFANSIAKENFNFRQWCMNSH